MEFSFALCSTICLELQGSWREVIKGYWTSGKVQERKPRRTLDQPERYSIDKECWVQKEVPLFQDSKGLQFDLEYSIEKVLGCLLLLDVKIPNLKDVRDYLLKFDDMIDLVKTMCRTARAEFGFNTRLMLNVYHDPEIDDHYLTLYVRQQEYDSQVLDRIDRISAEVDQELKNKSGWLIITTDFRPPR